MKPRFMGSYTGSVERLSELLEARDAARRKHHEAEEKLLNYLRGVKLSEETHPSVMHHVLNTENRALSDNEFRLAYGTHAFELYRQANGQKAGCAVGK